MYQRILVCLLSGVLGFSPAVYAGRYGEVQQRDEGEAQGQHGFPGPKQPRQPLHSAPPEQAPRHEEHREAPRETHVDIPRDQVRDEPRRDRDTPRDESRRDQPRGEHRRDRDDHPVRRDDSPRHWNDGQHRDYRPPRNDHHWRGDHSRRWDGGSRFGHPNADWRPINFPRRGHLRHDLPHGFLHLILYTNDYYYAEGVFYRPHNRGYIVVNAPIGAVVAELPRPFEMLLVDGILHYYVNNTYFVDDPGGFRVVASPFEVTVPVAGIAGGQAPGDLYSYPAQGQSPEQQSRDRYDCHRWGVTQTGFDPANAVIPNDARLPDYRRAVSACLEARGYTVK
jgi:hypothetical protein